jgi:hypothetical protein
MVGDLVRACFFCRDKVRLLMQSFLGLIGIYTFLLLLKAIPSDSRLNPFHGLAEESVVQGRATRKASEEVCQECGELSL